MPADFPVLTIGPDADSVSFQGAYLSYLETRPVDGWRETRLRHTWTPNVFRLNYTGLTDQDRLDLQGFFEDTMNSGADSFLWWNSQDEQTYEMKFLSSPRFRHRTGTIPERRWNVSIEMIEEGRTQAYGLSGGRLGEGRLGY